MSVGVEALFTSALGLRPPWEVQDVRLDTAKRRIGFQIGCADSSLTCPACGTMHQTVHDRLHRSWQHLDFFQFEAWLHCDVPRVSCRSCGKTTQVAVPWARPGSGFTATFEALALCCELPVLQAAALPRCSDKQLWRRVEFHVEQARALESMQGVRTVGIDETSLRRGRNYIIVMHDLDTRRLLFGTEGRDHQTVLEFAEDLKAHGGEPDQVQHVCMDMSAAYAKGAAHALPNAQISYGRFHVVAMAMEAMGEVRRQEMAQDPKAVRSSPKGVRAWRLKMALREVYAQARLDNDSGTAGQDLRAWLSRARHCRLDPFKKQAGTLGHRFDAVVRGMVDHRSNAFVDAMNGLLRQAKRAARGIRTSRNFIAIAYLRRSRLKHLASPLAPAALQ